MSEGTTDQNAQVSHEQNGRVLTGIGADAEQLAETMERHAPPEPEKSSQPTEAAPSASEPAAPAAPVVSRGRQRFSDLTKERDEAKAAADAAKAEREAAIRERDELKARLDKPAQPEQAKAEAAKPAEVKPTRPEPTEDEIGTKYATYGAFVRDLARWEIEQERAAAAADSEKSVREILARERANDATMAKVNEARERGRKAYADFDTLLASDAGRRLIGRTPEESIQRVIFIGQHPQSEHIQHAILSDKGELAAKLASSDPVTFGMTIAGLVGAPAAKPERAWTPPPQPHPTVGASSPTVSPPSHELAKKGHDFDKSGYREKRAAERGVPVRRR